MRKSGRSTTSALAIVKRSWSGRIAVSDRASPCRYHGWGYGLTGELRSVPDEASFYDLDIEAFSLTPIHVDTWNGFVFVNFSTEPEQSFSKYPARSPPS